MTGNFHVLPFEALSPQKFEEMCLWLVLREGYENAEYLGEAGGEQGRDVVAWRGGRRVVFQCKRVQSFTLATAKLEIDKLRRLPLEDGPAEIVFVVSRAVSADLRKDIRAYWGDEPSCHFWSGKELDERVKKHRDVVEEFFQLGTQAPATSPRIPHQIPPAAFEFIGRAQQKAELVSRLQNRRNTAVVGGPGFGKTALAAEALRAVVGDTADELPASPYPDGVVLLDLYRFKGQSELAWNDLANSLAGPGFLETSPAQVRAEEACRGRRCLIVIEGGEEANGLEGHPTWAELRSVFSEENRWLLLSRLLSGQAHSKETVSVSHVLESEEAFRLLAALTENQLGPEISEAVLALLQGHPLAITWAANLLRSDAESPRELVRDWKTQGLPALSDPEESRRTLRWLFERSARALTPSEKAVLEAVGLLGPAPFSLGLVAAGLDTSNETKEAVARTALKTLVLRGFLRRIPEAEDLWQFGHVLSYQFARKETDSDPTLRERLASGLRVQLAASLVPATAATTSPVTVLLEHVGAVLRGDEDSRLWDRLGEFVLYEAYERLVDLGRLVDANAAVRLAEEWLGRLPQDRASESSWRRERSVVFDRLGDVLRAQGDLVGALAAFRESLAISQALAAADPSNAGWQRDLSVSHERLGDVLLDQGDLVGALAAFRECLAIFQALAAADPSNAGWQRDLSVSHERLGDVLLDQGDLVGALAAFRESLARRQALAAADPSNAGWQRDLSFSLTRMAEIEEQQDHRKEARRFAEQALEIDERLSALDPTNATWQKDVAVSRRLLARLRG
ncbi:MAG: restriction endonuclease [Thermoanaerobaculia bacterium]|nr:restriction endonuclease [Thermoanaerobaculia bacterium]